MLDVCSCIGHSLGSSLGMYDPSRFSLGLVKDTHNYHDDPYYKQSSKDTAHDYPHDW